MATPADTRLVGRAAELRAIEGAVDALLLGDGGLLAVIGEAAVGKTALAQELAARAAGHGVRVLAGRANEYEPHVPYACLIDAVGEDLWAMIAGSPGDRHHVDRALRALLRTGMTDRPLVLLLDDLHVADPAAVELLAHLVRRPPEGACLVVLVLRPAPAAAQLIGAVTGAAEDGELTLLSPDVLTREETLELIGSSLDDETQEHIWRESGGNPFYTRELALQAEAQPIEHDAVPPPVLAAVREEITALPRAVQVVVESAAVMGGEFDAVLLAVVAGVEPGAVHAAMDEAVGRDLARPTAVPGRFAFRRPIVRRAIYESADDADRQRAHARAARALAGAGAAAAAQAPHIARSARPGDDAAVALLSRAAHESAALAPDCAARWFAAALRLTSDGDPRRSDLLLQLARSRLAGGAVAESRAAVDEAEAITAPGGTRTAREITILRARLDPLFRAGGGSRDRLAADLAAAPGDHDAKAWLALAIAHSHDADWDRMADAAAVALQAARTMDAPRLLAAAAIATALAEHERGAVDASRRLLDEAAIVLGGLADEELAPALETVVTAGYLEHSLERHVAAIARLEGALALARRSGRHYWVVPVSAELASAHLRVGDVRSAARHADDAADRALELDVPLLTTRATIAQSRVALVQGDARAALRAADEAVANAERLGHPVFGRVAHCLRAHTRIAAGDALGGRAEILEHGGGRDLVGLPVPQRTAWFAVLAEISIDLRRLDEAELWVARVEMTASHLGLAGHLAEAHRVRAALALALGRPDAAVTVAEQALSDFEALGQRLDAARTETLLGRALAAIGDREGATIRLERAHTMLATSGARRGRDQAARELRALGRRTPRAGVQAGGPPSVDGLTAREREVAELVARGLTNRQIAAELYVRPKTIEAHLSSVFAKLGVTSRAAVASAVTRADADPGNNHPPA